MEDVIARFENVLLIYHEPHAETLAIKDISIDFGRGNFTAIVGPSGCGKTTLLSMLAGILPPSSGRVEVLGHTLYGDGSENKRKCRSGAATGCDTGYMLQRDNLLDWRTIEDNVLLGLEIKHMLNDETRSYARELLRRYGLGDFMKLYPRQLSGGMRQKAALIRTLVFRPKLLLADEVHSIIRREGCSAVLVTHDISEAISMCDRIIVLTSRPATVRCDVEIRLKEDSPLARRNDAAFKDYFNLVWEEMMKNEEFN